MLKMNWNVELWKFKIIIFSDNYFKVFYFVFRMCECDPLYVCVLSQAVCTNRQYDRITIAASVTQLHTHDDISVPDMVIYFQCFFFLVHYLR